MVYVVVEKEVCVDVYLCFDEEICDIVFGDVFCVESGR